MGESRGGGRAGMTLAWRGEPGCAVLEIVCETGKGNGIAWHNGRRVQNVRIPSSCNDLCHIPISGYLQQPSSIIVPSTPRPGLRVPDDSQHASNTAQRISQQHIQQPSRSGGCRNPIAPVRRRPQPSPSPHTADNCHCTPTSAYSRTHSRTRARTAFPASPSSPPDRSGTSGADSLAAAAGSTRALLRRHARGFRFLGG